MRALATLLKLPRIIRTRRQLLSDSDAQWATRIGERALHIDGRTLHPRAQGYIEFLATMRAPVEEWSVTGMRAAFELGSKNFSGSARADVTTSPLELPLAGRTLAARQYRPNMARTGPSPAILFFHGGGFVIGSPDTHDRLCRDLAVAFDGPVVCVAYRRAPEHRLPAAFDDATDAYVWLTQHGEALGIAPDAIALAGDSAGAAMAVAACASATEAGDTPTPSAPTPSAPTPSALGLIYPPFGFDHRTPSKTRLENEEVILDKNLLDWFANLCAPVDASNLPDIDAVDFAGFPPTSITTCGFDPLRDEGAILAARLTEAGVHVDYQELAHLFHGFATLGALFPEVAVLANDLGRFLRDASTATSGAAPATRLASAV